MALTCFKCQSELPDSLKIMVTRREVCPKCMSDLRSCKMCVHYDPRSYNECRETSADRVQDKEKSNFCDFYKIHDRSIDPNKVKEDLLAKANALFKKD